MRRKVMSLQELKILGNVAVAMVLGGVIGLEREVSGKSAGLRTHMLVATAACLLVSLSDALLEYFTISASAEIQSDPIRIVEAVITGVSFLGAGTIIRSNKGHEVRGLTSAASFLVVAAIGITTALSQWILAVGVTFMSLIVLLLLGFIENRCENQDKKTDGV